MRSVIGALRCASMILCLIIGFTIVLLIGWLPLRIRGCSIPGWIATGMSRFHHWAFNIRFSCRNPEKIRQHRGFLFPNHTGYLDIVAMLAVMPARFLAGAENRHRPMIGYIAQSIGTVFVDRKDKDSRSQARQSIAGSFERESYPSIVLFPEGRLNPGRSLLPFFHGAFELAIEHGIPYLPCAILHSHPRYSTWGWKHEADGTSVPIKEGIMSVIWRVATCPVRQEIEVVALDPVTPKPGDDPETLANAAKYALETALGFPHNDNEMPENVSFD